MSTDEPKSRVSFSDIPMLPTVGGDSREEDQHMTMNTFKKVSKDRIREARMVFLWLPVFFSNDLEHGTTLAW